MMGARSHPICTPDQEGREIHDSKKRGMSWNVRGADCMCEVIVLRENGELFSFLSQE